MGRNVVLPVVAHFGSAEWLRRATAYAVPDGAWLAFGLNALGIAVCGAFVCACGGVVARRDLAGTAALPGGWPRRSVRAVERVVAPAVVTGLWVLALTASILVLAPSLGVIATWLVCVAIATAVRAAAYYSEGFSKMLARMLPFSLLAVVLLDGVVIQSLGPAVAALGRLAAHWRTAAYGLLVLLLVEVALRAIRTVTWRHDRRLWE